VIHLLSCLWFGTFRNVSCAESCLSSDNQEIPRILWKPNVYNRFRKCPLVPVISQINTVQVPLPYFFNIYSHKILPSTSRSFKYSLSSFPAQTLYTPILFPVRATCPAHLIIHYFIARIIFCEEYSSQSSSLGNLQHPCYLVPLRPNVLLSILFSNTVSRFFQFTCERSNFTFMKNDRKIYNSVYFNHYIFGRLIGRQKILERTVTYITCVLSVLSVFLFIVCMLPSTKPTSSAYTRS
jgi:hypothetical protein